MDSLFSRKKRKKTKRRWQFCCLNSFAFSRSFQLLSPFFIFFIASVQTSQTSDFPRLSVTTFLWNNRAHDRTSFLLSNLWNTCSISPSFPSLLLWKKPTGLATNPRVFIGSELSKFRERARNNSQVEIHQSAPIVGSFVGNLTRKRLELRGFRHRQSFRRSIRQRSSGN